MRCLWIAVLVCSTAGLVAAETSAAPPPKVTAQKVTDPNGQALRDEVGEVIDAYLLMKVQDRLGLTDEQFAKLVPLIKRQQDDRRKLEGQRFRALREMRQLFAQGGATDERIVALLNEVKQVEADLPTTLRRNAEAIVALLTPVQQAKYRLLNAEVEHHLRELRWQARDRRHGQGPDAGGPGPHRRGVDPRP